MPTTLGAIKSSILAILNKESSYQGFYTTTKLNAAVNDSIDWVYANMMFNGQGWNKTIGYLTTAAATPSYSLPTDCAVIDVVRYLVGTTYVVIRYDDQSDSDFAQASDTTYTPSSYRLVGNTIYFNPIPTNVGTNYVQLEYTKFPSILSNDNDSFDAAFTRGLENYVKWRACSQLVAQVGKPVPEWLEYERQWFSHLKTLVSQRTRQTRFVLPFREGWQ